MDFLNQPELLVALVAESAGGGVSEDMAKMKEVTVSWMQYMISRNFPPLTPHHTQAFTLTLTPTPTPTLTSTPTLTLTLTLTRPSRCS